MVENNKILRQRKFKRLIWFLVTFVIGTISITTVQLALEGRKMSAYMYVMATWFVFGVIFMAVTIMKWRKSPHIE